MAIFYGTDSNFIKGKQSERRRWLVMLVIFIIASLITIALTFRWAWYISPIALIVGIVLSLDLMADAAKDASWTFQRLWRRKGWSDRGLLGERIIKQKLEALPDSYSVFRNFHPGNTSDYDFIVVGPNGLFSIETKSQTGKMEFRGRTRGRKYLSQAKRETFGLRKYFLDGWKINTYVHGILAFARSGIRLPELPQPFENIYILRAEEVAPMILNHRGSNPHMAEIEERLRFFYDSPVGQ